MITVPFAIRRVAYDANTFIRNDTALGGLVGTDGEHLVLQFRETRKRSQGGLPLDEGSESELAEIRVPIAAVRRIELRKGWFRTRLMIAAADLRAFEPLRAWLKGSELILSIPRAERTDAADLASSVELALSTRLLGPDGV